MSMMRRSSRKVGVLAAAVAIAAVSLGGGSTAGAATLDGHITPFQIDGDSDGPNDWDAPYAALRDVTKTSEVCAVQAMEEPDGTIIDAEPNRVVPGTKLSMVVDTGNIPVEAGNIPKKTDLCDVYSAWELAYVPADAANPAAGGQYHFILYGAWTRPEVNGEIDVLFPLLGPDSTTRSDDFVLSYNFEDSDGTTSFQVLVWDAALGQWAAKPGIAYEAKTTRGVVQLADGAPTTFGEFAIDLTAAGILPENGPCVEVNLGDPITRTGNSDDATLMDIVQVTAPPLSNCGKLTVTKVTDPATPRSPTSFGFTADQIDGQAVQSPDVTSISGQLTVPGSATVTHDVNISPDYRVIEKTPLPDGWTQVSVVCTATDPLTGVEGTYTLYSSDAAATLAPFFPVGPLATSTCVITNQGPPPVVDLAIVKTASVETIEAGVPFTYTLAVSNAGPDAAADVVVTDTLPAQLTLNGAAGTGFTCSTAGQTLTCTMPTLAAGASAEVTVNATVVAGTPGGTRIANVATVSTSTPDSNPDNNTSTDTVDVPVTPPPATAPAETLPPQPTVPVQLPSTGSSTSSMLGVAAILSVAGLALLVIARRRRPI